jgi:TolB protein
MHTCRFKAYLYPILAIALCLLSEQACCDSSEEPIMVHLSTETKLLPIYLTPLTVDSTESFDANAIKHLNDVWRFDMDHNGMTSVLKSSKEKDQLARASSFDISPTPEEWKSLGAFYIIKSRIQNNKLSARLFAAHTDVVRSIDNLELKQDLAQDRRQVHQMADAIFKALFGTDGIAATRILYTNKIHQGKTWVSEVWECDYDGKNARQVTFDSGYAITPAYFPAKPGFASGGLFFVSYKTGQPKIYYQSLSGDTTARRLSYMRGNQLMPAISRQRDKVAFVSDVTGNPDLFIQPFNPENGISVKPYQIFSTNRATQGTPTFSPDGSQIAFVSNKDGAARIYMINTPESGASLKDIKATLISKHNKESTAPAWSPDGTKIAYCSSVNGVRQIWVYDLAKREERQLTQGPGNKENPSWAPNSLHLVFNSTGANACDLYLINLNQPEATKISAGSGEKHFPCWEPRH